MDFCCYCFYDAYTPPNKDDVKSDPAAAATISSADVLEEQMGKRIHDKFGPNAPGGASRAFGN